MELTYSLSYFVFVSLASLITASVSVVLFQMHESKNLVCEAQTYRDIFLAQYGGNTIGKYIGRLLFSQF